MSAATVTVPAVVKTLQIQVKAQNTVLLFDLRKFTPFGGEVEVTNTGTKKIHAAVTVAFVGESDRLLVQKVNGKAKDESPAFEIKQTYERTLAAAVCDLEPGESKVLCLGGVMPPGHVTVLVGATFDSLCEVITIPSPGNHC